MSERWQGRVGRQTLLVNAESALEAVVSAMSQAPSLAYKTEEVIDEDQSARLPYQRLAEAESGPDAHSCGAWMVRMIRVGFAMGAGSEYDSEYVLEELIYLGPTPHAKPHAQTGGRPWAQILTALNEREQLGQGVAAAPAGRKPGL